MTHYTPVQTEHPQVAHSLQIIRHIQVCKKLNVSSAKLFDMIAKGQFPKPFNIIPGGRAVGWLERDVDAWIMDRCAATQDAL
ncbi:AlpA Predicted transcriptional regulator [Sphingomonadaceae bacterium]|jgi:predicted DNA-binding transcriptional regulator AlpA